GRGSQRRRMRLCETRVYLSYSPAHSPLTRGWGSRCRSRTRRRTSSPPRSIMYSSRSSRTLRRGWTPPRSSSYWQHVPVRWHPSNSWEQETGEPSSPSGWSPYAGTQDSTGPCAVWQQAATVDEQPCDGLSTKRDEVVPPASGVAAIGPASGVGTGIGLGQVTVWPQPSSPEKFTGNMAHGVGTHAGGVGIPASGGTVHSIVPPHPSLKVPVWGASDAHVNGGQ